MHNILSFEDNLNIVNKGIENISFDQEPTSLFDPITYILSLGGKRVRPTLTLMAYNLYKENVSYVLPIALGIEIFHNFTLLHDDLMDKADMRRGQPTVHIKWNDNTAVLSGDAMLIEAYKEISKINPRYLKSVIDLFSTTASEICCGQQLDMSFEERLDVTIPEYIEMIRLKTAVLIACALKEGALMADADQADLDNLYDFGINIGLAFQLQDDLLDVYGDPDKFGKRIGGDILSNKKTFLLIKALSNDSAREELLEWIKKENYNEREKIDSVTNIYNKLELKHESETLITSYYDKAIEALDKVNVHKDTKRELYNFAKDLMQRSF